jgi:hypothetical protein
MKSNSIIITSIVLLSLAGFVRADMFFTWTGAISDDWMTDGNWDVDTVPADGALGDVADAFIGSATPLTWPVLDSGDVPPKFDELLIANGEGLSGELTVQGGVNLVFDDRLIMCFEAGSVSAKLTISGTGTTVHCEKELQLGESGDVVVDVNGGTLIVGEESKPKWNMMVAAGADSNVTIYIRNGGLIEHHGDYAEDDRGGLKIGAGKALIDIGSDSGSGGGTLKLKNDVTELVRSLSHDGVIVADGGARDVQIFFNDGYTFVTASVLTTRLDPIPADGETVPDGPTQLQWTLPEPNDPAGIITCDVYFGTNPKVEANPKVVTGQAVESVNVTLDIDTNYYWALDLYDSSVSTNYPVYLSPIFTLNTMNISPVVNAGDDVETWLTDGQKVIQLDGIASDEDGRPAPITLAWTVIAEPNESNPAQINDPVATNPTVTVIEPGTYTLQIEASDGEYTTADTMQIVLYADACEHAKNQEGFVLIPGDINEDCIVNELDLAILEENWLQWNYSAE